MASIYSIDVLEKGRSRLPLQDLFNKHKPKFLMGWGSKITANIQIFNQNSVGDREVHMLITSPARNAIVVIRQETFCVQSMQPNTKYDLYLCGVYQII